MLGWSYGVYDTTVIKVVKPKLLASVSWQWLHESRVHTLALPDFPDYDAKAWARGEWMKPGSKLWNNRSLIKAFLEVAREADVLVAHNGDGHDIPVLNTAVGRNGFRPLAPRLSIDTLKVLKGRFDFEKNGLGYVCEELGIGKKLDSDGLWERCIWGDLKAWKEWKAYNAHDVNPLLKGLYEFEKPWIRSHPNLNLTAVKEGCPHCGSQLIPRSDGFRFTKAGRYRRLYCRDCFAPIQGMEVGGKQVYRPI
jgi:predicted RNA-binding Zn-ribbon protein involved in translation (DUF1610 family)